MRWLWHSLVLAHDIKRAWTTQDGGDPNGVRIWHCEGCGAEWLRRIT